MNELLISPVKIYTHAHGAKTQNLAINFNEEDSWYLRDDGRNLYDQGVRNETELSFFNLQEYTAFKDNPSTRW